MARTVAPLLSLDASGSVGKAITFSKWKGRNYVRRLVIPSNPRSGAQVGRRSMLSFLAQQWDAQSVADKATWQTIADALVASPFNGYVSENMKGWHNFLGPSQAYPATRDDLAGVIAVTPTATWEENRIKFEFEVTTLNQNWGTIIYGRLTTGLTASVGLAIMAALTDTQSAFTFYWTPPSVATWYFLVDNFSIAGLRTTGSTEFSAVP